MKKQSSFTEIGQFRDVIRNIIKTAQYVGLDDDGKAIYDNTLIPPIINFVGTVKCHGTNSSVCINSENEFWAQSKDHIITPQKDNMGFAFFAESKKEIFLNMFDKIKETHIEDYTDKTISIFGEFCGGNIQKNVAINGLPKMMIIFAVKITNGTDAYYIKSDLWKDFSDHNNNIYNIYDFPSFSIDIDFNAPKLSQNKLIDLTTEVEKECPVGKYFGRKLGEDNTIGEGIVWEGWFKDRRYIFKVKGEKHSSTKVKKLAEVDTEKIKSVLEFVEYAVTENRLTQAIEQVFIVNSEIPDIKRTADFLRWIVNDVIKEELDTLNNNNLEPKDVNKEISIKARKWFFDYLNNACGL
jgi:hypothetical protein